MDGGTTDWIEVNNGLPSGAWAWAGIINPFAPNELCILVFGVGVYKTTDGGANWAPKNNGITSPELASSLGIWSRDSNALYYAGTSNGFVYRSSDRGESWQCLNTGSPLPTSPHGITIAPNDANLVYCGALGVCDNFWKSTDGGRTWALKNTGLTGYNGWTSYLVVDPIRPNIIYLSGYSGAVHKSTDYGETWSFSGKGLRVQTEALVVDHSNSSILYAGGGIYHGGCGAWKSTDKGLTWARINNGFPANVKYPYVTSLVIDPTSSSTLYAGTYPMNWLSTPTGVYKTTDGGSNWTEKNSGLTNKVIRSLAISPANQNVVYASTPAGLFKSVDACENWRATTLTDTLVFSLAIDHTNPATVYVGSIGPATVYKSTDEGSSWTSTTLPDTGVTCVAVAPTSSGTLYAGTEGAHVYKSTDAGQTWQEKSNGLPQLHDPRSWRYPRMYRSDAPQGVNALAIDPSDPDIAYVGVCYDEGSIYKTTDGGENWAAMNEDYAGFSPQVLVIDPTDRRTLYVGSYAGVWTYTASPGIQDFVCDPWRPSFAVSPNPIASGLAAVRYSLPAAGPVSLAVFDVTGRAVTRQTYTTARTGTRILDLRGLNAGVYVVCLQGPDGLSAERKLVILP